MWSSVLTLKNSEELWQWRELCWSDLGEVSYYGSLKPRPTTLLSTTFADEQLCLSRFFKILFWCFGNVDKITLFLASLALIHARVASSVYLEARKNVGRGFEDDWIMVASMHQFLVNMTYRKQEQVTDLFCSPSGYGR